MIPCYLLCEISFFRSLKQNDKTLSYLVRKPSFANKQVLHLAKMAME